MHCTFLSFKCVFVICNAAALTSAPVLYKQKRSSIWRIKKKTHTNQNVVCTAQRRLNNAILLLSLQRCKHGKWLQRRTPTGRAVASAGHRGTRRSLPPFVPWPAVLSSYQCMTGSTGPGAILQDHVRM